MSPFVLSLCSRLLTWIIYRDSHPESFGRLEDDAMAQAKKAERRHRRREAKSEGPSPVPPPKAIRGEARPGNPVTSLSPFSSLPLEIRQDLIGPRLDWATHAGQPRASDATLWGTPTRRM